MKLAICFSILWLGVLGLPESKSSVSSGPKPKAEPKAKAKAEPKPHYYGVYNEAFVHETPHQTVTSHAYHYNHYYSPLYPRGLTSPGYHYSKAVRIHPRYDDFDPLTTIGGGAAPPSFGVGAPLNFAVGYGHDSGVGPLMHPSHPGVSYHHETNYLGSPKHQNFKDVRPRKARRRNVSKLFARKEKSLIHGSQINKKFPPLYYGELRDKILGDTPRKRNG